MILSIYGQDVEKVIPLFSKFMGYHPFANHRFVSNPKCTVVYEWRRVGLEKSLDEIREDKNIIDLIFLDEGFESPDFPNPEIFYQLFTKEIVADQKEAFKENPQADINGLKVIQLLPFIKKVLPRIGKSQSFFGLSLICLDGRVANEAYVVSYGLEPLLSAGILTLDDAREIQDWYVANEPQWNSGVTTGRFEKKFQIDGQRYLLFADAYRNHRDLKFKIVS